MSQMDNACGVCADARIAELEAAIRKIAAFLPRLPGGRAEVVLCHYDPEVEAVIAIADKLSEQER